MTDPHSFEGTRALVLGANDPTAAAIAVALAEAGADVAVTSTTGDAEEAFALRPLRRKIEATGRNAIADIADLGNGSSVQIAVRQVAKQMGGIDLLVLAPRETLLKRSQRLSDAEWARVISYNLGAYFYACRAVYREFASNAGDPKGRIIALLPAVGPVSSSEEGGVAALLAARAGAGALVPALASEWRDDGIVVSAIALSPGEDGEAQERAVSAGLRLASEGAESTGRVIDLDGGE